MWGICYVYRLYTKAVRPFLSRCYSNVLGHLKTEYSVKLGKFLGAFTVKL